MTNQEIFELLERFGRSGLASLKLRRGDFSLELSRASASAPSPALHADTLRPSEQAASYGRNRSTWPPPDPADARAF